MSVLLTIRDPELVKRIGAATALEVRATGIPYVFAPCIAVAVQIIISLLMSFRVRISIVVNCMKKKIIISISNLFHCLSLYRFVEIQDGVDATRATVKILRSFEQ